MSQSREDMPCADLLSVDSTTVIRTFLLEKRIFERLNVLKKKTIEARTLIDGTVEKKELQEKLNQVRYELGKDEKDNEIVISSYISQGTKGDVFLGTYQKKPIAVKRIIVRELNKIVARSENKRNLASSEVSIMQELTSAGAPNVVHFYFANTVDSRCFYVCMEYMNLGSLNDFITKYPAVSWDFRLYGIKSCAKAISFMHERGILHNDIKSDNVLVTEEKERIQIKLADFSFACKEYEVDSVVRLGTKAYMAPECFYLGSINSKASDVFSFATLTWKFSIWSEKEPYDHINPPIKDCLALIRVVNEADEAARQPIPADCPLPAKEIMVGGWRSDPSQRISIKEALALLDDVNADSSKLNQAFNC